MKEEEREVLIGRLALHYKLLEKEQVAAALKAWRGSAQELSFGEYLVAGGLLDDPTLERLRLAEREFLRRQHDDTQSADVPAAASQGAPGKAEPAPAPAGPAPAAPTPAAPSPAVRAAAAAAEDGAPHLRFEPGATSLEELLSQAVELGASDLHLHSGAPLKLRFHGELASAGEQPVKPAEAERLIRGLLAEELQATLDREQQVDFAHAIAGVGRFRGNAYRQQRGFDAVFRAIPARVPSFADLNLPVELEQVTRFHQGLVLFTGPSGCGKSATMAAAVDRINRDRPEHVIVVEDPIEIVHESDRALINQRQVGPHTRSFARALRAALREDPDVIAIGELRDLETISLALTAAETGHLVFGTLHTAGAVETINRLLGVFPPDQQAQIRVMVSESLRAVVSQRLVRRADGGGRVPALEILYNTKAVASLVRESKTYQIRSVMQTGGAQGMCLLDASLAQLVKSGAIDRQAARQQAAQPERFGD